MVDTMKSVLYNGISNGAYMQGRWLLFLVLDLEAVVDKTVAYLQQTGLQSPSANRLKSRPLNIEQVNNKPVINSIEHEVINCTKEVNEVEDHDYLIRISSVSKLLARRPFRPRQIVIFLPSQLKVPGQLNH